MNRLKELIVAAIRREGPLTFARYMEAALYHPDLGYYMTGRDKIGEDGDFVTAPSVSPLLARALAEAAADVWGALGRGRLRLVEYGPGRGEMMRDILAHLAAEYPELHRHLEVVLVEASPALRAQQEETLSSFGRVTWAAGPGDRTDGLVLANEFVDALPFHRVAGRSGGIRELYVGEADGRLVCTEGPLSPPVQEFLARVELDLPEGHLGEVCPAAGAWLRSAAGWLDRGCLLTVDYGLEAGSLLLPARALGTVRSFRRHRLVEDPLSDPGGQDITAHVNFTALARLGREVFGRPPLYTTQGGFILHSGLLEKLAAGDSFVFDPRRHRLAEQLRMLAAPGGMGEIFKVMAFYRGGRWAVRGMARGTAL